MNNTCFFVATTDYEMIRRRLTLLLATMVTLFLAPSHAQEAAEPIPSKETLSPHQKLQYNSLLLIEDDFNAEQDEAKKKALAGELLDQSLSLAEQVPDLMEVWEMRAETALHLGAWSEGWQAGQNLLRLGALVNTSRRTTLLMAKMNRRGWLNDDARQVELRELQRAPELKSDSELPETIRKELSDTINKLSMGKSWDGYNQLKALRLKLGDEAFLRYPLARRAMAQALPTASSRGSTELAKAAISAGADVNMSVGGRSALFWAAYNTEEDIVRLLITAGAKADVHDKFGRSILAEPGWKGAEQIVRMLTQAGANPNVKGKAKNLLHEVVERGHHGVVKALVEAGVNTNTLGDDEDPIPVLLIPVRAGDQKMVRILVDGGANPKARYQGKDMFSHARKLRQKEIVKIMKKGSKKRR